MSENFFVYVLGSEVSMIFHTYVGWTNDLDRRLVKHNTGQGARFTKGRKWQLLYAERYKTKSEAMSRMAPKARPQISQAVLKCYMKQRSG